MNRDPVRIGFLHPGEMGTALAKVVQPPPGDLIRQPLLSAPALPA